MDYWLIFILLFIAGTLLLLRTSAERHFVVFMIRTKYGLKLLDKFAEISPRVWTFIADFAIVFSFAGLGAWYIAKHRRIEPILFIISLLAALIYYLSDGLSLITIILIILFIILLIFTVARNTTNNPNLAFVLGFIVFFLITLKLAPGLLISMGNENNLITAPQIAHIILSIFAGIIGIPALLIGTLMFQGLMIITEQSSTPGVSPILPSVKDGQIGLSPIGEGYEFFFIPIHYALIAIAVLLIVHEFAHGVLSRVEKIKVKSAGLLTLGPFPIGGFVEPDEEELKKGEGIKNMRISSMGSFANFVAALIFFLLLIFVIPLLFIFCTTNGIIEFDGVVIESTVEGYPAYGVIENGSVIKKINNEGVTTVESFRALMLNITPYQNITLTTDKGVFVLETVENPENSTKAHIGIYMNPISYTKNPTILNTFYIVMELFQWIFLLNLMIGLVNLLPIVPFDGGRMFNELVNSFKMDEETKKKIIYSMIIFGLLILLVNLMPLLDSFFQWIMKLI